MGPLRRVRLRLRALFRPAAVERELSEEVRFHIDMQTEENLRAGMPEAEARRRAVLLFGGVEGHKEECRDARGTEVAAARMSWLDVKLGVRMLVRYPGLILVGGLAITVATGLGAAFFEFSEDMFNPRMPFPGGDRLVTVETWDAAAAAPEYRTLHELGVWREEVRSLEELGAFRVMPQTLTTDRGRAELVSAVQISPSGFRLVGTPPLLGRPLIEADAREGAPPVVVIGHDVWRRLYAGDPGVVGRAVRLGAAQSVVVGVMPEGFRFPMTYEAWTPLPDRLLGSAPGAGPPVQLFGRLARGVSPAQAEAELGSVPIQRPEGAEEGGARLSPRVNYYVEALINDEMRWAIHGIRLFFVFLMAVACVNVATLVFARTATREGEIAVRSALGASRRRIVLQLFVEALVLTSLAAALGLAAAGWGLRRGMGLFWEVQDSVPPFWWDDSLSPRTVLFVGLLAVVGALVVGVLPALKATGRRVQPTLNRIAAGGSGPRFGGMWTAVIVIQVALSVAFLPFAIMEGRTALRDSAASTGFPAAEFLTASISREWEVPLGELSEAERTETLARAGELFEEVRRRVEEEPGVEAVTFASGISGMNHPRETILIGGASDTSGVIAGEYAPRTLWVHPTFFEVMDAPIVAGSPFPPGSYLSGEGGAIVNQRFVRDIAGGQSPVGRRVRFPGRPGADGERWHEIVGVVRDPPMDEFGPRAHPVVYLPQRQGGAATLQMFVRLDGSDATAAPRLQAVVASIDPALQIGTLATVQESWRPTHTSARFFAAAMAVIAAIALLLSMAGIHALMSFVVSRRAREIGIRTALGARPRRIVATIFSRAFLQLGAGVLLGSLVAFQGIRETLATEGPGVLVAVAGIVLAAGLLACSLPAWRALRIQPTEALKAGR